MKVDNNLTYVNVMRIEETLMECYVHTYAWHNQVTRTRHSSDLRER